MSDYERSFGRRKGPNPPTPLPQSKPFGKRRGWVGAVPAAEDRKPCEVVDFRAVAAVRLTAICNDLVNLYGDSARTDDEFAFRIVDRPELELLIGQHASVRIDEARGLYVLAIRGSKPGSVTVETGSDDLLLDYIICHLALDRGRYSSVTSHGLASLLVGRTLEDVERSLILATLRQHHFNRTRSAEVLGISVRTIRNKLRGYRDGSAGPGSTPAGVFPLRHPPPRE